MLKRRDSVAISNVGNYLKTASSDLTNAKGKLLEDINSILESYQGNDANIIVERFKEAAMRIDSITSRLDYYSTYMVNLSNHDRNNIDEANRGMSSIMPLPTESEIDVALAPNILISSVSDGGESDV